MELQLIKPRRALRFRTKQEIFHLREKYESLKQQISMTKFSRDHDVPTGIF